LVSWTGQLLVIALPGDFPLLISCFHSWPALRPHQYSTAPTELHLHMLTSWLCCVVAAGQKYYDGTYATVTNTDRTGYHWKVGCLGFRFSFACFQQPPMSRYPYAHAQVQLHVRWGIGRGVSSARAVAVLCYCSCRDVSSTNYLAPWCVSAH